MGGGQKGKREREADRVSRWEGGDAAQRSRAVPFPLEKAEKIVVVWVERKEGEERRAANDGGLYAPLDIAAVKASPALSAQSPALPVDTYHIDSPPKLKNGMKKPPRKGRRSEAMGSGQATRTLMARSLLAFLGSASVSKRTC